MMKLDQSTALVVIDVQKAIDGPDGEGKNNPDYISRVQDLLSIWRARGWPVFHVKHNSKDADSAYSEEAEGNAFKEEAKPFPGEMIIEKVVDCAFINTGLGSMLRMEGAEKLLICGVTTQYSVEATVRHASALGFETFLMRDACSATPVGHWSAQDVHDMSLAILEGTYCEVVSMQDIFAAM